MRISLTLHESMVRISPTTKLGESQFNLFLAACKGCGAKYDARASAQTVSIQNLAPVVDMLRGYGFTPSVSPTLFEKAKDLGVTSSAKEALDHLSIVKSKITGRKLLPHQEDGVRFLASRKAALLLDGTGTGKTGQASCAIPLDNPPVLIICPAIVKNVWAAELKIFRSDLPEPKVLSGRGSFRFPLPGEILIINYDILPDAQRKQGRAYRLDESFGKPHRGTVLIFDEIHRVKGRKGGRSKKTKDGKEQQGGVRRARGAFAIAKEVAAALGYVWGLTGTPLKNHPGDLWNICGVVGVQSEAFTDWPTYLRLFGVDPKVKTNFFGGIPWSDPSPEVAVRLQRVALRRTLESVMPDMPPLRIQDIRVDIDKPTKEQCDRAMEELAKMGISLEDALEVASETKGGDIRFQELSRARTMLATAKIPHALEIIDEAEEEGQRLLVFSTKRAPVDILKAREGWATITGSVTGKKRQRVIDEMQAGRLKGIGITIASGGEGITLTRASRSLFVDQEWSPADNNQAIARMRRIGQTVPQLVQRLIANHDLDVRIAQILDSKQALNDATVEKMTVVKMKDKLDEVTATVGEVKIESPRRIESQEPRRGPISPVEHWAALGMSRLSSLDADRAEQANLRGFSRADSEKGNALAERLQLYGLTNREWVESVKMLMKYQGQVGMMPIS